MRAFVVLVAMLVTAGAAGAFPLPKHRTFVKDQRHPDEALIESLRWLFARVSPFERCYYRFFHFLDVSEEDLHGKVYTFHSYLPKVSRGATVVRPFPVDKAGRVWAVDIRDTLWTPESFRAVTRLELKCREPNLDHWLSEAMRDLLCLEVDVRTFHCEGLVPGVWFTREIMETDRRDEGEDQAYYNLLYARERFGDVIDYRLPTKGAKAKEPAPRPEQKFTEYDAIVNVDNAVIGDDKGGQVTVLPRGVRVRVLRYENGDSGNKLAYIRAGSDIKGLVRLSELKRIGTEPAKETEAKQSVPTTPTSGYQYKKRDVIDRNFPRDFDDWNRVWGGEAVEKFLAEQRIFKRNGQVVAGSRNLKDRGSIVSYHDRVMAIIQGPIGKIYRTWDFKKTSGRGNVANQPLEVALAELIEDAGEHIVEKEDGYPADLLTDGAKRKRKRLEVGNSTVVHASIPGQVSVLTNYTCIYCHGPEGYVIAPSNKKVPETQKQGVDLLVRSPGERQFVEAFFDNIDERLEKRKYDGYRLPFEASLAKATINQVDREGWAGSRWADEVIKLRDWYDDPVTLDQAAAELGIPRLAVMLVCLGEGSIDAQNLFLNIPIPRDAWDDDLFPRLALLLAIARNSETPDPMFVFFFPELVRDAYEWKGRFHN